MLPLDEGEGEGSGKREGEGEPLGEGDCGGERVSEGHAEAEALPTTAPAPLPLALPLRKNETLRRLEAVAVAAPAGGEVEPRGVPLRLPHAVALREALGDALPQREADTVAEPLREALALREGDAETEALSVPGTLAVGDRDDERLTKLEGDSDCERLPELLLLPLRDPPPPPLALPDGEPSGGEGVVQREALSVGLLMADALCVIERAAEGEVLEVVDALALTQRLNDRAGEVVALALAQQLSDDAGDSEGDPEIDGDADAESVGVSDSDAHGEADGVRVADVHAETQFVAEAQRVALRVAHAEAERQLVLLGEPLRVGEGELLRDAVPHALRLREGVPQAVDEAHGEELAEGEPDSEGVNDGLAEDDAQKELDDDPDGDKLPDAEPLAQREGASDAVALRLPTPPETDGLKHEVVEALTERLRVCVTLAVGVVDVETLTERLNVCVTLTVDDVETVAEVDTVFVALALAVPLEVEEEESVVCNRRACSAPTMRPRMPNATRSSIF